MLVLTGDGEQLMALGALATIAVQRPANLAIVVLDNERYGETGMQATHTAHGVDLAGIAAAAGFPVAGTIRAADELEAARQVIHHQPGPILYAIKVRAEPLPFVMPPKDGAYLKDRFRLALLGPDAVAAVPGRPTPRGGRPADERGPPIHLAREGAIAQLILDRPDKRNALSLAMWQAIPELVGAAAADPEVKVLILRGATADAFSAGADIAEFDQVHGSAAAARHYHDVIAAAYAALADLEKPTIAMVQGACFGGGCALALCCDLRYADPSARFCIPPARLGLAYSLGETKRLVDLVGPSKAKEMLMGATVLDADGSAPPRPRDPAVPDAELEAETLAFARHLCTLSQFTIRAVKQIVGEIMAGAVTETELSQRLLERQFEGPDYLEGRRAFLEKRPPVFTWR